MKFRRQFPLGRFVIDFYSRPLKFAIELDGKGHLRDDQQMHDEKRDAYLAGRGITILRITNSDLKRDPETVALTIEAAILALGRQ